MTLINFPNTAPFVGGRPYADVKLNPTRLGVPTYKCLVDTGADFLVLPASAAGASGLSLSNTAQFPLSSATGSATMFILRSVAIEIEGYAVNVDVVFDPTNKCPPLVGRGALLAAFSLGMESSDWHWT